LSLPSRVCVRLLYTLGRSGYALCSTGPAASRTFVRAGGSQKLCAARPREGGLTAVSGHPFSITLEQSHSAGPYCRGRSAERATRALRRATQNAACSPRETHETARRPPQGRRDRIRAAREPQLPEVQRSHVRASEALAAHNFARVGQPPPWAGALRQLQAIDVEPPSQGVGKSPGFDKDRASHPLSSATRPLWLPFGDASPRWGSRLPPHILRTLSRAPARDWGRASIPPAADPRVLPSPGTERASGRRPRSPSASRC